MFDLMVFTLINAFWFTLIVGTSTLFVLRVLYTTKETYTTREKLMIWFIPLSIGFYHFEKQKNIISKIYRICVLIFFYHCYTCIFICILYRIGVNDYMIYNITKKQNNSDMCFVCGIHNDAGLNIKYYELENKHLIGVFKGHDVHQSYPQRMHGGITSALLDETIGRAVQILNTAIWGCNSRT